jgi:hypothetical protein
MNNAHTPAPWNACYKNHDNGEIYFAIMGTPNGLEDNLPHKGAFICKVTGKRERMEANARLISAAPDLLSALEGLMKRAVKDAEHYAPDGNEPIWAFISDASDAICKAKGKA